MPRKNPYPERAILSFAVVGAMGVALFWAGPSIKEHAAFSSFASEDPADDPGTRGGGYPFGLPTSSSAPVSPTPGGATLSGAGAAQEVESLRQAETAQSAQVSTAPSAAETPASSASSAPEVSAPAPAPVSDPAPVTVPAPAAEPAPVPVPEGILGLTVCVQGVTLLNPLLCR